MFVKLYNTVLIACETYGWQLWKDGGGLYYLVILCDKCPFYHGGNIFKLKLLLYANADALPRYYLTNFIKACPCDIKHMYGKN